MNSVTASGRLSITLRERVPQLCPLGADDLAFLMAEHRDHVAILPTDQPGHYRLTPTGHVGTIVCPGTRLIIRPKIAIRDLFHLLDPTAPIAYTEDDASPEPGTEVFNFLAARFAQLLGERVQAGLYRGYAERHESGAFLQGRLDVAAQVRSSAGRKDRLHCTYEDFTTDLPCNQLVKATAILLLHSPLLHDRVAAHVHQLLPALEAIRTVALCADRFCEPLSNRLTEDYRPLLALCRLLFDGLAAGQESGAVACPAFLLNMERVFERYVSDGVREAFANHPRYSVAVQPLQGVSPPRPAQPDLQIRPDMLVSHDGQPVAVLDAKWKKLSMGALRSADIYQVLAYAAVLGLSRAILVYPGSRIRRWQYRFDRTGLRLEVYTLRVTGSPCACQRSLRKLGNSLRTSIMS